MKISFLGGAGTVTGSKFLLADGADQILVDCGLFQGLKQFRLLNWMEMDLDPSKIKAVLLTHAHIDHCGALPLLVKQGYQGPIFCTGPTQEIAKIILEDAAKIQMEEADYANRKNFSKHHPAQPLFDSADVARTLPLFQSINYNEKFNVGKFEIEFKSNGHILGSAAIYASNGKLRLLFSGDLGRQQDPLMTAPDRPPGADIVLMESTYGDRLHEDIPPSAYLTRLINDCWRRKSILLIPAFALGRSQNLIYEIHQLKKTHQIPLEIPVYFNSPMGSEICDLYCKYSRYLKVNADDFAASVSQVHFIRTADQSRQLNERKGPAVIIAASGMLTGGRVLHHLKAFAPNSNNTILLAGFQAAGTRGWSLVNGKKQVKVHGEYVDVQAQIIQSDSFSAHADQRELLQWLAQSPQTPKQIFLIHGEPSATDELRKNIEEQLKMSVTIPFLNSNYDLTRFYPRDAHPPNEAANRPAPQNQSHG